MKCLRRCFVFMKNGWKKLSRFLMFAKFNYVFLFSGVWSLSKLMLSSKVFCFLISCMGWRRAVIKRNEKGVSSFWNSLSLGRSLVVRVRKEKESVKYKLLFFVLCKKLVVS